MNYNEIIDQEYIFDNMIYNIYEKLLVIIVIYGDPRGYEKMTKNNLKGVLKTMITKEEKEEAKKKGYCLQPVCFEQKHDLSRFNDYIKFPMFIEKLTGWWVLLPIEIMNK